MEPKSEAEAEKLFARALEVLATGETPAALALLERALKIHDNPAWYSYLGYCIAKERGQVKKGSELCSTSTQLQPDHPEHYLNQAKVHLVAGQKVEALGVLRDAMSRGGNPEIAALLEKIGTRKPPVFSFLSRDHFLNRFSGLVLVRLGLR